MAHDEPELANLAKKGALKVESHQISALCEGKGALLKFTGDLESDDSDSDPEYGNDTEDEAGYLETIRPDPKRRVYAHDEQTKQSIIKEEVMALTEDLHTSGIRACGPTGNFRSDFADSSELELTSNEFAPQHEEEYKSIHRRYSNLGKFKDLIRSGVFITLIEQHLYKNPLIQGTGQLVGENSTVIFDCACWTEKCHEPYDSTWLRKRAFVAELSNDTIIPGIKNILRTMRKGERCEAIISPDLAYGHLGVPPRIPKNATIFSLIQVLRIYDDSSLARMLISPTGAQQRGIPFRTFVAVCNDARTLGNYYLRKGDPWKALDRYRSARTILDSLVYKDENEEKTANALLIKLYNNSANALLQLHKPRTTLTFCKLALELDSKNVKAHWFYVRSWEMLKHYDRALKWALKGKNIAGPYRTNFFLKIEKLQQDLKSQTKMNNDLFRRMGSSL